MINIREFKKPVYSLYVASIFINALALFTVRISVSESLSPSPADLSAQALTYLTISAAKAGINANISFALLSIANATSTFGRLAAGLLADRYGTSFSCFSITMTAQ